ncbi:hypothetical protein [Streptomyces alboflavus]|nr:hypothetical protein [Streptomyces alboflavus]
MTDQTTPAVEDSASELAALRALNRSLLNALQEKTEVPIVLLPVFQDGPQPAPDALVPLLLVLWRQARAEAEAYRAWIRQPAPAPVTDSVTRQAADAVRAHLDGRPGPGRPSSDLIGGTEHSHPHPGGPC